MEDDSDADADCRAVDSAVCVVVSGATAFTSAVDCAAAVVDSDTRAVDCVVMTARAELSCVVITFSEDCRPCTCVRRSEVAALTLLANAEVLLMLVLSACR